MNIIITMVGKSRRFKNLGIYKPKFYLPIEKKKKIIEKITDCYDDNDNFHLVISKELLSKHEYLKSFLKKIKKNIYLNIIEDHDLGPAYSAISAKSCINKSDIIVTYCDFLINWDYKKFKRLIFNYDFAITSFHGFHPSSFSGTLYCYLVVKNNEIKKISEKNSFTSKPYNEFASTGSYYFKNFDLLYYYSNKALNSNYLKKKFKETYMSLPYLFVLKEKKSILNFQVDKFISLGTPRDYLEYKSWYNFFNNYK